MPEPRWAAVAHEARSSNSVARCTLAEVLILGGASPELAFGVQAQSWEARDTVPNPMELLRILVVNAGGSLLSRGMECYWTHSLACSQVTAAEHMIFAVKALRAKQGTNMAARDVDVDVAVAVAVAGGGDVDVDVDAVVVVVVVGGGGESRRMGNAAQPASAVPGCQSQSEARLKVHTAGGNKVDQTEGAYREWNAAGACRRALPVWVGSDHGVVGGLNG